MTRLSIRPSAIADIDREAFRIADYSGEAAGLRFFAACDRALALLNWGD